MAVPVTDLFNWLMLAALLGVTGQLARTIIGLKKMHGGLGPEEVFSQKFNLKRLSVSLLLAVAVGGVAGVLSGLQHVDGSEIEGVTRSIVWGFVAAGYAGTDVIEGLIDADWEDGETSDEGATVTFEADADPDGVSSKVEEALALVDGDADEGVQVELRVQPGDGSSA